MWRLSLRLKETLLRKLHALTNSSTSMVFVLIAGKEKKEVFDCSSRKKMEEENTRLSVCQSLNAETRQREEQTASSLLAIHLCLWREEIIASKWHHIHRDITVQMMQITKFTPLAWWHCDTDYKKKKFVLVYWIRNLLYSTRANSVNTIQQDKRLPIDFISFIL